MESKHHGVSSLMHYEMALECGPPISELDPEEARRVRDLLRQVLCRLDASIQALTKLSDVEESTRTEQSSST